MGSGNILDPADDVKEPSETTVGHEVFSALTALFFLRSIATVEGVPTTGSVDANGIRQSKSVDAIAELIRQTCGFSSETMAIYEDNKWWLQEQPGESDDSLSYWLALYSGSLEAPPFPLSDRVRIDRLVVAGIDAQMVELLHALIRGVLRNVDGAEDLEGQAADVGRILNEVTAIVASASPLSDPLTTYRMWRLVYLRRALDPNGPVPSFRREQLRALAAALELRLG